MSEKPKVLVVDDTVENREVLVDLLEEEADYDVLSAENGRIALDLLKDTQPDLILLDVMMPVLDGFGTARELQKDPELREIPVIFMTALADIETVVEGLNAGAVDYITKPFHIDEVLARIETQVKIRQQQKMIAEKNRALEMMNQEKNDLMGIVAHDLKNPLAVIMGNAQILELFMEEDNEMLPQVNDINRASQRMLRLITDLLDINAVEQGKVKLNLQSVAVHELVAQVVRNNQSRADAKRMVICHDLESAKFVVTADANFLEQALDNLVSNAIKYSPTETSFHILVEAKEGMVHLGVEDEGPGIAPEEMQKLFKKFSRLSPRPTGGESSTGLGLSIVKKFIEAMGGDVWCESVVGEGSTFWIKVPLT